MDDTTPSRIPGDRDDLSAKVEEQTLTAELVIATDNISISDAYEMRDIRAAEADKSFEAWNDMSEEYRQILTTILQRSLETLHGTIQHWLPYSSLRGVGHDKIDFRFTIFMSDVESQVDMLSEAAEFEQNRVVRSITQRLADGHIIEDDAEFMRFVEASVEAGKQISVPDAARLLRLYNETAV